MASTQPELHFLDGDRDAARGKLFTIPPTTPFLEALARAVLAGNLPGESGQPPSQFDLAGYEIYLPNRAACRALAEIFLRLSDNAATLLPRIRPLGSAEEDTLLLLPELAEPEALDRPGLPVGDAIGPLDRRMALTRLVMAWAQNLSEGYIANSPAAASELALELMRLMDEAETEGVDLSRLAELLPERFAGHEQLSLSFLNIVIETWPAFLAEQDLLNPVDRRNRLMALEAERLRRTHPETPVIVAGSTGSIPATAELMEAVASLPKGAIVLPGLDLSLDQPDWAAVADHPEHPQAGLHRLLADLEAERDDVRLLKDAEPDDADDAKVRLLSEAMRPAATLGRWQDYTASAPVETVRRALDGVSLIAAPTEQDEAAAIALIMRETMETPSKTASLVTPDHALARRVAAELNRWGLRLDARSGEPLLSTPAGIFHDLAAEAAMSGDKIALLALLKHPYTHLGLPGGAAQKAACIIELAAMRQPWCGDGVNALAAALDKTQEIKPRHAAIDRLTEDDWDAAYDAVDALREGLKPLSALAKAGGAPLQRLAAAHAETASRLSKPPPDDTGDSADAGDQTTDGDRPSASARSPDDAALAAFLAALAGQQDALSLPLAGYPALFRSLIRPESVPPGRAAPPRLQILTAMDARLTSADLVILAGLNEGAWPQSPDPGPWLNRAMRDALGLPPPERKTRLAAHDFAQMLGAREVVLTRALKSGGAPTVPSRWLMRLTALLKGLGLDDALKPPRPWLTWALQRNEADAPPPVKAPAPRPPLDARPRSLSVSDIERLIANPYAIYAQHVLGLAALPPLAAAPGGAEKGQIIHDVMHRFTRRFPEKLPADCASILMSIFDERAALYGDRARILAFWRPRMERFAAWFAETEAQRRGEARVLTELRGRYEFEAPGGPFRLRARADRIDLNADNSLAIYDYKSGSMPNEAQVAAFKAPQLPLEALIAREGGFEGVASPNVARLAYISAKGGDPAGIERALTKRTPDALADGAHAGLSALVARFDDPSTPYTAMRRAAFAGSYRYDDYAHLARVQEWAGSEEAGE